MLLFQPFLAITLLFYVKTLMFQILTGHWLLPLSHHLLILLFLLLSTIIFLLNYVVSSPAIGDYILDLILTSNPTYVSNVQVVDNLPGSDHDSLFFLYLQIMLHNPVNFYSTILNLISMNFRKSYHMFLDTVQGRIQDFLREGASQADMTDVQSQKSAKELPNMHASANWVSWQGTTDLLTALIEYLTGLLE